MRCLHEEIQGGKQVIKTNYYWTIEETELLKENYNKCTNEELVKLFPNRTFLGIYKRARKIGLLKDRAIEFENRSMARRREKSSNWNGGRKKNRKGYVLLLKPEHERADSSGYVFEHIVVFEEHTKIKVPSNCCIHHLNGNKADNRIENLCLMDFSAHTIYHNKNRRKNNE